MISDSLKKDLAIALSSIHEASSRSIFAYYEQETETFSTPQSNESSIYQSRPINKSNNISLQKKELKARVFYPRQQDETINNAAQVPIALGRIRIKIKTEDENWIRIAKKIEVDGEIYFLSSSSKSEDQINQKFVSFYLNREN